MQFGLIKAVGIHRFLFFFALTIEGYAYNNCMQKHGWKLYQSSIFHYCTSVNAGRYLFGC